MSEFLPHEGLIALLKGAISDAEWVIKYLEKTEGWLQFPTILLDIISSLSIEKYPFIYEDEQLLTYFGLRFWQTDQEISATSATLEKSKLNERGELLKIMTDAAASVVESIVGTSAQANAAQEHFAGFSEEEKREAITRSQAFYSFFFASFGQTFSMMMHGEKLTTLVARAKAGDDEAFCKAIRIDRRILTVIPYFREKYERAGQLGNTEFLEKVGSWIGAAPYKGRIRHKSLWVVFSILDQAGMLWSLSHNELLDICNEVGVGGADNRIEDVGYLSKRLREYRKLQQTGIASTP